MFEDGTHTCVLTPLFLCVTFTLDLGQPIADETGLGELQSASACAASNRNILPAHDLHVWLSVKLAEGCALP